MDVVILSAGAILDGNVLRYIGPYKAAHVARKAGYSVQVIDHILKIDNDTIFNLLDKFINQNTKVLALTTTFVTTGWWMKERIKIGQMLKYIKMKYPSIRILYGGYQSDTFTGFNLVDDCIIGYSEDLFVEYLDHIFLQKQAPVYIKGKDRNIFIKSRNTRFDIFDCDFNFVDQDALIDNEVIPFEISRGCIFKCKFCRHNLLGKNKIDYLRSFDKIKQSLVYNKTKWNIDTYFITCDTFNDSTYKVEEWHKMAKSLGFPIKFGTYARADLFDRFPDSAYQMQESGLYTVFHGIETFGYESSKIIGKGWSGVKAKEFLPKLYHDIWQENVLQHLNFIVGLPGDTKESYIETLDWFFENDMYSIYFHPLQILDKKVSLSNVASEFDKNYEQ